MFARTLASIFALGAGLACAQNSTPAAPSATPAKQETRNVTVIIETSMGSITAELDADKAPLSVSNFLAYADQKFYDGTIFHRVIPGFMAQGGGFTADMNQKPTQKPVKNEAGNGLKNARGTLAMARTSVVDSATAQFFINLVDNSFLNHSAPTPQGFGYAVFGKVTAGMDVVDQIAKVPTGNSGPFQNVPSKPVTILSVRRQAAATPAK
jgi:peptidyl-prolyl cis-trans isomerase A (cyclophilin A)